MTAASLPLPRPVTGADLTAHASDEPVALLQLDVADAAEATRPSAAAPSATFRMCFIPNPFSIFRERCPCFPQGSVSFAGDRCPVAASPGDGPAALLFTKHIDGDYSREVKQNEGIGKSLKTICGK